MHKINIDIKPLSVNRAWQGRRYKTAEYKAYEKAVGYLLPKLNIEKKKLKINISFYFSNIASDLDNPVKMLLDIMQKKYGFNDKDVYELNLKKFKVKKKEERIYIEIT